MWTRPSEERDWKTLGPKLVGEIHVAVGTRDTYYLDNAVRLLENFLKTTNYPYYAGDFEYGPHQRHCWTGGKGLTTFEGYLTTHQRTLRQAAAWMQKDRARGRRHAELEGLKAAQGLHASKRRKFE
jgi:hypothetical protein